VRQRGAQLALALDGLQYRERVLDGDVGRGAGGFERGERDQGAASSEVAQPVDEDAS